MPYSQARYWMLGVIAVILVAHILFALLGANPNNPLVVFVAQWADALAIFFRGLFATGSDALNVILNYGLAAVFWVVVGVIAAWLLSGLGRLVAGRSGS